MQGNMNIGGRVPSSGVGGKLECRIVWAAFVARQIACGNCEMKFI